MYVGSPKSKIMYLMYCSFNLGLKVGLSEEVTRGTIREEIKILMCLFCTKCSATDQLGHWLGIPLSDV